MSCQGCTHCGTATGFPPKNTESGLFTCLFICLAASGLSCSSLGSPVVACSLSRCSVQVQVLLDTWDLRSPAQDRTHIPCIARRIQLQFLLAFFCYLCQMSHILLSFPLFTERKEGREGGERRREGEEREKIL